MIPGFAFMRCIWLVRLGLETCNLRPNDRLRYRGAWLWVGSQMIHLMELPNPDPITGRPAHGGEDRHICVSVKNPMRLKTVLENAGNKHI